MTTTATSPDATRQHIAFIGGGNMASAIIGGLLKNGFATDQIRVIEPHAPQRDKLLADFGLHAQAQADVSLGGVCLVVWAVKPQNFREAAQACAPHVKAALHLSVAAGIRADSIAMWLGLGSEAARVVRAMPNTPALVGLGMSGLYAMPAVGAADRAWVERVLTPTGQTQWFDQEVQLDAVTALSGSGPAYVFFFIEAMMEAGQRMGLSVEQARQLAIQTFIGASELARASSDTPQALRAKVTSKGGTTHAAITSMEAAGMKESFIRALQAAQHRATELGDEFGR
jgi:pyrroline-5-carboxylate reductase